MYVKVMVKSRCPRKSIILEEKVQRKIDVLSFRTTKELFVGFGVKNRYTHFFSVKNFFPVFMAFSKSKKWLTTGKPYSPQQN